MTTKKTKIEEIEGIGPAFAAKLSEAGIAHCETLLSACATAKGRQEVAAKTQIPEALILKWTNRADLMRVKGIGKQYSELLENAGVDTVKELRQRRADNLTQKMNEINAQKNLCRVPPSEKVVADWIKQATALEATMTY